MIKINMRYIVTKGSDDGVILIGDTMNISHNKMESSNYGGGYDKYSMFLPMRDEGKSLFGMRQINNVKFFDTKELLIKALKGVEVILDTKWAQSRIDDHEKDILKLRTDYGLL